MSRIALGTHLFGRENADACHSILEKYFSGGGNVIDTGRVYHGGESEYVIGDFLRKNGMSGKAVIITKGGNAALPDGTDVVLPGSRVNAKCIEEDIKISLDALGSENIDIYFVHKDNPETTVGEIIEVLNKYIKNGSLRHIGASNWTSARIAEANAYAAEHGLQPFEFSELAFSLKKNSTESWGAAEGALEMEKNDFDWYRESGMPVFGYNPQAYGFFYRPDAENGASAENVEILRRFRKICSERGLTAGECLFGFYAGCGIREIPIVSTMNPEHLRDIIDNSGKTLDVEDVKYLLEARFDGKLTPDAK
ncbi:MAG: aldo/keto reductase [Eubacteriales bacterium]